MISISQIQEGENSLPVLAILCLEICVGAHVILVEPTSQMREAQRGCCDLATSGSEWRHSREAGHVLPKHQGAPGDLEKKGKVWQANPLTQNGGCPRGRESRVTSCTPKGRQHQNELPPVLTRTRGDIQGSLPPTPSPALNLPTHLDPCQFLELT